MKVVALAGGTGSAKLLRGLASLGTELTVVANVGDNAWIHGLYVCPDIDIAIYALAGVADRRRGWGVKGDTFNVLKRLGAMGQETWFALGDKDLATHIMRTGALKGGSSLTEATEQECAALGLATKVIPATDSPVETMIGTTKGELPLQEFWVREGGRPRVTRVRYSGAVAAAPSGSASESLSRADRVVVCPANPVTSIGPMLAMPGFRKALTGTRGRVVALSPMVGQGPFSGPAGKLMAAVGVKPTSAGVAGMYADFLDAILVSRKDARMSSAIESLGIQCRLSDTLMSTPAAEKRLARELLEI